MPRLPKLASRKPKPRKSAKTSLQHSEAFDYFSNALARMGYGTPSLPEATEYNLVRLSNNFWLLLTLYRNHWIVRRVVDVPAMDMTRAWPKLTCELAPEDIQKFDRTIRRTQTVRDIRTAIQWARLYGGSGALIAIRGHEDILDEPLDLDDVEPGSYLGLIPFDRWVGIYPEGNVSQSVDVPGSWGLPQRYLCTAEDKAESFYVDASRVLRFVGPPIPTPEFQAQIYWGLSVIEPMFEQLRMHDNCLWALLQLLFRAQILARVEPDLAQILSGASMSQAAMQNWANIMQVQNELLSNQSMMILGKDASLQSTQYSFAGMGELYAQFQMEIAGAAEIPVTRLFGRTITGLGQSNDADERYYEETIAARQDSDLRPQLDRLYPVICMSEFGEVPDDLDFTFPSVRVLTEEERADLTEKSSAPVIASYNAGIFGRKTTLRELKQIGDLTGTFTNITDEMIDSAEDEPEQFGEMPGGGEKEAGKFYMPNPNREEKELSEGAET